MKLQFFFLIFLIHNSIFASVSSFQEEFKIQLVTQDTFQSTYSQLTYDSVKDSQRVNFYIDSILSKELRKYPKEYFNKIGLKTIVLTQSLQIDNQSRAAVPDPYKQTLFLSIESEYSETYLIHVFHHELHHITEYALWENMYYDWKKWKRKNTKNYEYGNGGASAYENQIIDWYRLDNPEPGFVNLYSTTGQEEDRCEIMALLMTDEESAFLKNFISEDKFLKKKLNLLLKTLNKLSKSRKNYWNK